jgi:hypothetical protein
MTTTADLTPDLGVDEGDVDVLLEQLGESEPQLRDDLAGFLHQLLDPHGERTAPAGLYWSGADDAPKRRSGWAARTRPRRATPQSCRRRNARLSSILVVLCGGL